MVKKCRIGQNKRCESTGCEWKKHFNQKCWLIPIEFNNNKITPKTKHKTNLKEEEILINKIKTPYQDDWIKKIKTI